MDDSETNIASSQSVCSMPDCIEPAHARGFCRLHYDKWRCQIRTERHRQKRREQPFAGFKNAYRKGCGYWIIFEVLRTNQPLTTEQLLHRCKIELVKANKNDYRIDYAFEIMRAKRHFCKRGDFQMWKDPRGRWHLIRDRAGETIGSEA